MHLSHLPVAIHYKGPPPSANQQGEARLPAAKEGRPASPPATPTCDAAQQLRWRGELAALQ
ncbi:MAG: hypothetical protein ACK55I_43570, partial [bacterium]